MLENAGVARRGGAAAGAGEDRGQQHEFPGLPPGGESEEYLD